jgi:RHH-type proline utilization regulon transcriptional repressor/proline dehydrogenase/delta 1-pyrroline-5-carboxylate dehydrogenase
LNSSGVNLPDPFECDPFAASVARATRERWTGGAIVSGKLRQGPAIEVRNPANRSEVIGSVTDADEAAIEAAFAASVRAQPQWDSTPATERAEVLERAADLFESRMAELVAFCGREGGRTIPDSISEVREAVDFLRYYADRARAEFGRGLRLPGPTGESNELRLRGRGVFVCISPWNAAHRDARHSVFAGSGRAAGGAASAAR